MNYNNSTGQYRDLKKTWTYPGGSAVPDNWNPFPCVKKQSKEDYCYSCKNQDTFLTLNKVWNYQKPYSC